jgi:hypothetical protein
MATYGLLIIGNFYFYKGLQKGKKHKFIILIILCLPFFVMGDRETIIVFLTTPIMVYHFYYAKIKFAKLLVLGAFLFLIIGSYGYYRTANSLNVDFLNLLLFELSAQFSYSEISNLVYEYYPGNKIFYNGSVMFGDFLFFIPRFFWPGKPLNYGSQLVQMDVLPQFNIIGGGISNFEAMSPLALGYADFGKIGIILSMIIIAIFLKSIRDYFTINNQKNFFSIILFGVFFTAIPKLVRGLMGSILQSLFLGLLPLFIIMIFLGNMGSIKKYKHSLTN